MAIVTDEIATLAGGQASVSLTYDDTTGEIQQISWVVNSGTLTVNVQNPPKAPINIVRTSSGSQNVPSNQYFLTFVRGGWSWTGAMSATFGWHA